MEFHERIAAVRKAAGLTQEQLGELVGVSRQAVSKWESGQTLPDVTTLAALCEALHVSADYVLLGKAPEASQSPATEYALPDTCPCCGRPISGNLCPACGYQLPNRPPRGPKYAVIATNAPLSPRPEYVEELERYCGLSPESVKAGMAQFTDRGSNFLLRRNLDDLAASYIVSHLDHSNFNPKIVLDEGEDDAALLSKSRAMDNPAQVSANGGIGFWGVVGAVIVALLILSFL